MAECSICGKEDMTFTCKYCGEKFCSDHRLPENHDCDSMEEEIEKEKEESRKWFEEKEVKHPAPSQKKPREPSIWRDIKRTFFSNYTLLIIGFTTLMYFLQSFMPGISPPITQAQFDAITNNPMLLNPLTLYPSIDYLLARPWTILTVMFLHGGFFHIFANMVTFYFFGTPIERVMDKKKFLAFYFGSGIAASLGIIVFRNFLAMFTSIGTGAFGPAVGASGAVIAMFAAVAMLYPEAEVLLYFVIPMKIKTALYAFAGLEAFNLIAKAAGVYIPVIGSFASSAHLTGLIVGVWFGKKLQDRYARKTNVFNPLGY